MWKLTPKPFNYSVRGFSDQPLSAQCWRTAWHHHQRAPPSLVAGKGWNAWTSTGRAHQAFLVTSVLHWVFSSSSTQPQSEWSSLLPNTAFNECLSCWNLTRIMKKGEKWNASCNNWPPVSLSLLFYSSMYIQTHEHSLPQQLYKDQAVSSCSFLEFLFLRKLWSNN